MIFKAALKSSRCITCRLNDECQGNALHCVLPVCNNSSRSYKDEMIQKTELLITKPQGCFMKENYMDMAAYCF